MVDLESRVIFVWVEIDQRKLESSRVHRKISSEGLRSCSSKASKGQRTWLQMALCISGIIGIQPEINFDISQTDFSSEGSVHLQISNLGVNEK